MQSYSQIINTNKPTPNFLQTGCVSCRPTNSECQSTERKNITFRGLAYPKQCRNSEGRWKALLKYHGNCEIRVAEFYHETVVA